MPLITLDFETAYGAHPETGEAITLSKLTTEEYVRHPRFKVHGLGVKIDDQPAFYVYGKEMVRFLKSHPWEDSVVLAQHSHFDGAILGWRCGIRPKFWCDTLSMANALFPHESSSLKNLAVLLDLGEKGVELQTVKDLWDLTEEQQKTLGGYCVNDVDLTYAAFQAMKHRFPVDEFRLIDLNTRLFTEPVLQVEPGVLLEEFKREKRKKRDLIRSCVQDPKELTSNDKFVSLLMAEGVEPPKKLSPSKVKDKRVDPDTVGDPPTGRLPSFKAPEGATKEEKDKLREEKKYYPWTYAFGKDDEEFKALLDHPSKQVQALVEARMGVKSTIKETRSKRFYKIGKRGRFPVYHKYYGARTGRDSGGDKQNTTNLTRVNPDDPTSGALRKSLLAPPGHMLVVADLSQIEARVLAMWAGQEDLVQLFRDGGDLYNRQASLIFGYEVNRKSPEHYLEGLAGKASVLGCGYQMGWGKFQEGLRVGFMGMPPLLFKEPEARKVGASLSVFTAQRSYRKGCKSLYDEAVKSKPLNVSLEDHLWHCAAVKQIVDSYRRSNPAIVSLWREAGNSLTDVAAGVETQVGAQPWITTCAEGMRMPNGMVIRYHKLSMGNERNFHYLSDRKRKEWSWIYSGKVVENCVQGLARIILTDQMLRIADWLKEQSKADPGKHYRVVTSTYDEVVCVVPENRAEETLGTMCDIMAVPPDWCADLPLKAAGGWADNYGDCEK